MNKIILNLFYFSIITLNLSCLNEGNNSDLSITANDKDVLRHLKEVEWPKAYAEQDTLLLDRILGDDFQMIDQSGAWYDKAFELNWIKKNSTKNNSFNYEIKRFEFLENGTAIICGTGHVLKDSIRSIYQSSNVLIKRNGKWEAVLSHVSGVKKID